MLLDCVQGCLTAWTKVNYATFAVRLDVSADSFITRGVRDMLVGSCSAFILGSHQDPQRKTEREGPCFALGSFRLVMNGSLLVLPWRLKLRLCTRGCEIVSSRGLPRG